MEKWHWLRIEPYAGNARAPTVSGRGIVFGGAKTNDKVYAVVDKDGDLRADDRISYRQTE